MFTQATPPPIPALVWTMTRLSPSLASVTLPPMASLGRTAFARAVRPASAARLSPAWAARRTYNTPANGAPGSVRQEVRNLAAEALAQKTSHTPVQPTAPKGKNRPSKIEKTPTHPAVYAFYALLGITIIGGAHTVGKAI